MGFPHEVLTPSYMFRPEDKEIVGCPSYHNRHTQRTLLASIWIFVVPSLATNFDLSRNRSLPTGVLDTEDIYRVVSASTLLFIGLV